MFWDTLGYSLHQNLLPTYENIRQGITSITNSMDGKGGKDKDKDLSDFFDYCVKQG